LQFNVNQTKNARKQSLDQTVNLIGRGKTHFHVELGKLRLPIGAQVLIAKTTCDLVVLIQPGNHADLFEDLGRLWQREKFSWLHARGHDVIARALGGRLDQVRRFDLGKPLLIHVLVDFQKHAMTQAQVGL
jgi:hypothetical protein